MSSNGQQNGNRPPINGTRGEAYKLREEKFIAALAAGKTGAEAAREAGYSPDRARQTAYELVTKRDVRERIQQRLSEQRVTGDEIIATLSSQLRGDIASLLTADGHLRLEVIRERGLGHLVKKIKVRRELREDQPPAEVVELELYSAQEAARILGRLTGLEQQPRENQHDRRLRELRQTFAAAKSAADKLGLLSTDEEIWQEIVTMDPEVQRYRDEVLAK